MNRSSVSASIFLILLLPLAAYGHTVDIEVGDLGLARFGGAVSSVADSGGLPGRIYETRLLPSGYSVRGYEVLWEQWEELSGEELAEYCLAEGLSDVELTERSGGVECVSSGSLLGYDVLKVSIDPVRVEPGGVSILRGLRVRVESERSEDGLQVRRRSWLAHRHVEGVVGRALGLDVSGYGDWALEGYRDWISDLPGLDGGVVDCVIICPDDMVEEFERLASWHDGIGVRTVVRGLGLITGNYTGSDPAERVRNFIRDAYENWGTVYVLLGGDATVLPMRYAWTNHYGGESIPTDLYYANLEGSWNENGNDIFGEWGAGTPEDPGDGVTLYPQVMTGRLPVRTQAEAAGFVDKIIAYATEPAPGWARKTLLLGEVIFPVDWKPGDPITLDGKAICDTAATYFPAHIDTAARYQADGTMDRDICLRELSEGHNFVIIAGHGDAFRTSTGEGDPPFIFSDDFDTLSNYNGYSFFYALNCNNSAVDVDCVFRHFLMNPGGGGIATYATTRYDFPNIGQYFLNEFCDYLYNRGITRLGDVCGLHHHMFVLSALLNDGSVRWSLYTYLLCGDPVLHVWVDEPDTFDVVDAGSMAIDDSTYSVTVYEGGGPVEGATVVMVGDRGEYGVGLTDAAGLAVLDYRPKGPGFADLIVSGEGFLVYGDSVDVTGVGGLCYVSGHEVDDGGGWTGNGDGEAGWGERVGLGVSLVNGGGGTLNGVVAELRAVDGCSLWVDADYGGSSAESLVFVGRCGWHPASMPFGIGIGDEVLGRPLYEYGEDYGCWLWLDAAGWHVRFGRGDDSLIAYRCSIEVHGGILGYRPWGLETGDSLLLADSLLVLAGGLDGGDYEDGFDFGSGADGGVVIHDGTEDYGSVGSVGVTRYYDVEFWGMTGDRIGIWFELDIEDDALGSWRDWFRVLVRDGSLNGERVDLEPLVGDSLVVIYGIRNTGTGGLKGIGGTLRALSGIVVEDSVNFYGDISSNEYAEGDGFVVRSTGGEISFEVELEDAYGKVWLETITVRNPSAIGGLEYESGDDYIELSWGVSGDSLFEGYNIYRAAEYGGEYSLVHTISDYAHLVDLGLDSEEDYYYYVCVRDSIGNTSSPSETLEAWTGSPYQAGWPVGPPNVMYSSVCIDDIDGDGDLEIASGSKDGRLHVWEHDGSARTGWPKPTGDEVWSSPAMANLDGDPELELIVGSNDGNLYAWNHDGTGVRNPDGFFRNLGGQVRTAPAIDDIDGDRDLEIFVGNSYGQVYCWHHDGTGYLQINGFWGSLPGAVYGSVALGDLDGDDSLEVIAGSTGGAIHVWNHDGTGYLNPDGFFANPGAIYGSLAIGDLDGNTDLEIVMAGMYWQGVAVYDHNGYFHTGWPRAVKGVVMSSPALAELDGDGKLDIVLGTNRTEVEGDSGCVYVFSDNGDVRTGWPQYAEGDFESSPVVGDIDGDGDIDMIDVVTVTSNYGHQG